VDIQKTAKGNYPLTVCSITEKGMNAYEKYVDAISVYFKASGLQDN
jgi:hypothetical protein